MIELRTSTDVIRARASARDLARAAGLGVMDQTRFATAVSELGRHALALGAAASCELAERSDPRMLRLLARIIQARTSSSGGGQPEAPGVRQMVDAFDVEFTPDATHITVQIVCARRIKPGP